MNGRMEGGMDGTWERDGMGLARPPSSPRARSPVRPSVCLKRREERVMRGRVGNVPLPACLPYSALVVNDRPWILPSLLPSFLPEKTRRIFIQPNI